MGNKSSNVAINKKLGVPITKQVISNASLSPSKRGSILTAFVLCPDTSDCSEYAQLYHVITVSPRCINMFCLLTGDIRSPNYTPKLGVHIVSSSNCKESVKGNILITAESDKTFKILHTFTFKILSTIDTNSSYKITYMMSPVPDLIYSGFQDGSIQV